VGSLLAALPVGGLSAGALGTLVVVMVLRGRLVPRQTLLDKQAEIVAWREAAEKWQATSTQLGMSMEKLLVYAEMTQHAIVDIRELAQGRATLEKDPE
jgi:hypothetical protein